MLILDMRQCYVGTHDMRQCYVGTDDEPGITVSTLYNFGHVISSSQEKADTH